MTLTQPAQNFNLAEKEPFHFAGFSTPNTTAVPDDFFDVLAPNLSEAELRVLIYIIRRTFGFKKDSRHDFPQADGRGDHDARRQGARPRHRYEQAGSDEGRQGT